MSGAAEPQPGIAVVIEDEDEFGGDYEPPGTLRPQDVQGTVIYTVDWSVSTIVDQIDADPDDPDSAGVLVTAPPFQRRTAWTEERQSLFIESLMLGLPIPPLVLAESQRNAGQFYVLDGKQRLTALKRFVSDGDDALRLSGLELLDSLMQGKTYSQVQATAELRRYAKTMLTQPVRTIVVRNWRTPSLLHLIFSRLNKASVPLASHELRQALHPGPLTNYVNEASGQSRPLLRARRLEGPDFRLRDAETLLRYLSFRTNLHNYTGDLRDFLDRCLKGGNAHYGDFGLHAERLLAEMEDAIEVTFEVFGDRAFLRYDAGRRKYMPRFNIAVFDVMTWYFADSAVRDAARSRPADVREAFERLCSGNGEFAAYLTSTTKTAAATTGRISLWGEALALVLNLPLELQQQLAHVLPIAPPTR